MGAARGVRAAPEGIGSINDALYPKIRPSSQLTNEKMMLYSRAAQNPLTWKLVTK